MKEYRERKTIRMKEADYNSGIFFVTLCVVDRLCVLSRINSEENGVELLWHGEVADQVIQRLNEFYDHIDVKNYIIMPNHLHILMEINSKAESPEADARNAELSRFISTFKRFCNKEYGENIWQRGSYDHIIRSRRDYEEHNRYIFENPMRWRFDELLR